MCNSVDNEDSRRNGCENEKTKSYENIITFICMYGWVCVCMCIYKKDLY